MATNAELVARLYIAYYDRAPDPVGLEYWIGRLNAGVSLTDIANSFAASPEAKSTYPYFLAPNVLSPDDFLAQVYLNVFGRAIDTGPGSGLEYYGAKLAAGVSPGEVLLEIIQNAVTNTTPGNTDAAFLANKVEVGLDWAQTAGNSYDVPGISLYEADGETLTDAALASAHGVIDGVTADPASVDEGKAETDAYFVPTFHLTKGDDHFDGTTGNDNFSAPLTTAIDGLVGAQTLQGSDILDGKGGRDVLNAELNGTGTTNDPTISNIEVYNLRALGNGGDLDLSRASGFEEIWNKGSRADLDVLNVGHTTDIGMQDVLGGTTFYFEYDTDVDVVEQNVTANKVGSPGSGPVTFDLWNGNLVPLTTLNLDVSNGVYLFLEEDANWMENFNISGSGILQLEGDDDFDRLVNLDSTQYTGDLNLDVSGSTVLETVATGDGNDRIVVNNLAVDGGLSVDLGAGDNTLAINDHSGGFGGTILTHTEISNLDFTGGVANVQTLEFVDDVVFFNDGTLDLTGFDVPPTTIKFVEFDGNGNDFTIANAGPDLLLTASDEFETGGGGKLTVDGVVNLTVESTGTGDSDVRLEGSVSGDVLETLTVNAADDAQVVLSQPALPDPAELTKLKDVSVNAAGDDATLTIKGNAGVRQVLGVHQVEQFVVNVNAPVATATNGNIVFSSGDLDAGVATVNYASTALSLGGRVNNAAADIAAGLNGLSELDATSPTILGVPTGNTVTVEWADFGPKTQLSFFQVNPTSGNITSPVAGGMTTLVTAGVSPVDMVPGTGYEALETVSVNGADNATANLTDVYGHFTLEVNAGVGATDAVGGLDTHNATVNLLNTEVTTVTVTAPDHADVNIGGDTIGARSLTTVTVTADTANVDLGSSGHPGVGNDFTSFKTLDVSSVVTHVNVDASEANFHQAAGQFVTYEIGATQNGNTDLVGDYANAIDVDFIANAAREVFSFVGSDIGEVELNGFTAGNDPLTGDRIDLSHFNIHSAGELIFTDVGGDLHITDLGGNDFSGTIVLVGLAGQATDVSAFNIIYA